MKTNEIIKNFKKENCSKCKDKEKCEGIIIDIERKAKCIKSY